MSVPSGYKVSAVDLTDFDERWFCSSCGFVPRLVVQTGLCEHLYCEKCLAAILRQTNPVCVKCERPLQHCQWFPDNFLRREIECKFVHCKNTALGCDWRGELKSADPANFRRISGCRFSPSRRERSEEATTGNTSAVHQHSCPYIPSPCRNDGCTNMVPAIQLTQHEERECSHRQIKCEYCGSSMISDACEDHYQSCPNVAVTCDRCGKTDIPRGQLWLHVDPVNGDCNRMYCPFRAHGCSCDELLNRESLARHLSEDLSGHLLLLPRLIESIPQQRVAVSPPRGEIRQDLLAAEAEVTAHSWALSTQYRRQEELVADVKALVVASSETARVIEQVSLAQRQENVMLRNKIERLEEKFERLRATVEGQGFSLNALWRFIRELLRLPQWLIRGRLT